MDKKHLNYYNSWKKSLDIAKIDYNEQHFLDNVKNIKRKCCCKYSFVFYTERYFMFSIVIVEEIYSKNKNVILSNRINPYDIQEYATKHGITLEDAEVHVKNHKEKTAGSLQKFINKYGDSLGQLKFEEFCKKSAHSLEKYEIKYGADGKSKYEGYLKSKSSGLKRCIERYGEDDGKKFNESINKKRSFSGSFVGLVEHHGEEKAIKICNNKAATLEKLIDKYGEEDGSQKYRDSCRRKSFTSSRTYYIERYGEEYGNKFFKQLKIKRSPIYKQLCLIYNEEKATRIYLEGKSKKYKQAVETVKSELKSRFFVTKHGSPVSKQSNIFFNTTENEIGRSLQYGLKRDELKLFNEKELRFFYYDCFDVKSNTIIEFHGVAYHPKEGNVEWVSPYGETYTKAFMRDKLKRETAVSQGYNYIEIWSDASYEEKQAVYTKLKNYE